MDLELQGKAVIVTGGAAGIGAACVRAFAAEGARIAVLDRDGERGESLTDELKRANAAILFLPTELTNERACRDAIAETERVFGGIDFLVNNAGVNDSINLAASPAEFRASLEKNLVHVFAVTHFARAALIAARGAIVNLGSKIAITGQGDSSGYAAAKGGILALTREWAVSLAPHGVRVNCVVPAECDTPLYQRWLERQPDPAQVRHAIEQLVPLDNRLTTPEEIAATVVFLASPRASHTTGQIIFVDGGYTHLDRAATLPKNLP
jgi:NAD(P)-dependent dehydrogenase (short-subunit alcohol dehydrogenase family)